MEKTKKYLVLAVFLFIVGIGVALMLFSAPTMPGPGMHTMPDGTMMR